MARPLRLEFSGALYHVTSRGDRREDIYETDDDRLAYLDLLGFVCEQFNWICHAYCLMDNHYHLLIETPDANLSKGMRHLNGVYSQTFNRAHHRVGHVYQGPYKAILVEREAYLLELSRYIVLNPVRAEMVRSAKDWPWSSYRETAGLRESYGWLNTDWLLSSFSPSKRDAVILYAKFVAEGKNQPSPWKELRHQIYLGSDDFIKTTVGLIDADKDLSEIPKAQRRAKPDTLETYNEAANNRNQAMVNAFSSGG